MSIGIAMLLLLGTIAADADDWPQWRGPHRDGVWSETGVVEHFASEQLPRKWRVPLGSGYCGPTVAQGRVVVMDRQEEPEEVERIVCFDEQDGHLIWERTYKSSYGRTSYAAGPRASVTLDDGQAFAFGTMGHLHCLALDDGEVFWQRDLQVEYDVRIPVWGLSTAPLLVDDLVVVQVGGGDGASLMAFDRRTGEQRWQALDGRVSYSAPIVRQLGDLKTVIVWNGDELACVTALEGKVLWRIPFPPRKMPIGVATPIVNQNRLFVSSFYDGAMMVQLGQQPSAAELLWRTVGKSERNTEALHCMISTPLMRNGYIYGVDSYGQLRCLEAATGKRIWEDLTATPPARWSNIHIIARPDCTWMFNERGELLITKLSPQGFEEISRTQLIEPTTGQLTQRGGVCWSHPAFANRHVFARNDKELVCADLTRP